MDQQPTTAEPQKQRRHWFQFRLRTLLVGMAMLGIACCLAVDRQRLVNGLNAAKEDARQSAADAMNEHKKRMAMLSQLTDLLEVEHARRKAAEARAEKAEKAASGTSPTSAPTRTNAPPPRE